jgi:hypothetical protein
MLEMIAHPDGGRWTGAKMVKATDGRVTSSYFTSLRDGAVDVPRADKLEAIAEAMGFPTGLWFKDIEWWRTIYSRWLEGDTEALSLAHPDSSSERTAKLAQLVNRLFSVRINPETGALFTSTEVVERSGGALTIREIDRLRSGNLADPTWGQILALCEVFEVPTAFFSGWEVAWFPSPALLDAAKDRESYVTFTNSRKLSDRDRTLLHTISEHLRREQGDTVDDRTGDG